MQKAIFCCMGLALICLCTTFIAYAQQSTTRDNSIDLSGIYLSDKQTVYYIKQINSTVWILGTTESNNGSTSISNIFSGTLEDSNSKVFGKWIDSPLSNNTNSGSVDFNVMIDSDKNITLTKNPAIPGSTGVYPSSILTKYDPSLHSPLTVFVSLENVLINEARSPTSDILYIGISGQKNNDAPLTATKYLGTRGDGSNITANLRIGPFTFNNEDESLKVNILGLDKAGSRTSFTLISLRDTLIQLMEPTYDIGDLTQATNIINSISPGLIPGGCNGLVFFDEMVFSSEFLRNSTAFNEEYTLEKTYTGTVSPPGCGPPSQYVIKLSILAHEQ
ncbi:MAG TPA: hypothetical protein VFT71_03045 [Candidatus Nitrosocosmicus sp.]|nr:hypothetical protein [Candidatus Nitrosocosmicus sp.]